MARALVLAEGALGRDDGKTAHGLVLHSLRDEIVAVIDSRLAGQDAGTVVRGRPAGVPIVASYDEGMAKGGIEVLYLGAAPVGGKIPASFRATILRALREGLTVYSGLHTFLSDDPEFNAAAVEGGGQVVDVRKPPAEPVVANGRIFDCTTPRILVMGTDCAVGKRMSVVELVRGARARGLDAGFVATGQTGCMLGPDVGAVIDRIAGDFAAGQVEKMICDVADQGKDIVFAYGQSSILHPAYSGVALAILHGARPHAVILQHDPVRVQRVLFSHPRYQIADLRREIELIESLGDTKVVGIAVNGKDCDDVPSICETLSEDIGLPAVDPLQMDVTPLLDAAFAHIGLTVAPVAPPAKVKQASS